MWPSAHRHVGQTNMNVYSSRSHTIFRMVSTQCDPNISLLFLLDRTSLISLLVQFMFSQIRSLQVIESKDKRAEVPDASPVDAVRVSVLVIG